MWYSMRREARAGSRRSVRVRSADGLGSGDGVEGEASVRGERLAGTREARGAGWKDLEERFRESQGFGRECFEDGSEGLFLVFRGDDFGDELAVAAEGVAIIEAADLLRCGFGLVAFEEIEGDERVFKLGEWSAVGDGVFAEAFEGGCADGHDAIEFVGGIGAVVPKMGVWVRAAERTRVFVGDVDKARLFDLRRGWR